ncbi:hypothetical protein ACHAWF_016684, partial [Thalassiosira exigua]
AALAAGGERRRPPDADGGPPPDLFDAAEVAGRSGRGAEGGADNPPSSARDPRPRSSPYLKTPFPTEAEGGGAVALTWYPLSPTPTYYMTEVQAVDYCSCSPTKIAFTINLDGSRRDEHFGGAGDADGKAECWIEDVDSIPPAEGAPASTYAGRDEPPPPSVPTCPRRDGANPDRIVEIASARFEEFDVRGDPIPMSRSDVGRADAPLVHGDRLEFASASSFLDASRPLSDQLSIVPGKLILELYGKTERGELVRNQLSWLYQETSYGVVRCAEWSATFAPAPSEECEWVMVDEVSNPWPEFCPSLPPGSPTISPKASSHALATSSWPTLSSTFSYPPSSQPSMSPTYSGGCANLTVSILLPSERPHWDGWSYHDCTADFFWRVNSTRHNLMWGVHYKMSKMASNGSSIVVEHTNGTNSNNQSMCLPEGLYSFAWGQPPGCCEYEPKEMFYVLSSDGKTVGGGDLVGADEEFQLTFEQQTNEEGTNVSKPDGAFAADELLLLQCYFRALREEEIARDKWFDGNCGQLLEEACNHSDDAMGFSDIKGIDDFCAFHQCARNNLERQYGCECLFLIWECNAGIGSCGGERFEKDLVRKNALECCRDGAVCDCLGAFECEHGHKESCYEHAGHCCEDGDESCQCGLAKQTCTGSLRPRYSKEYDEESFRYEQESPFPWESTEECSFADDLCDADAGQDLFRTRMKVVCLQLASWCGAQEHNYWNCATFSKHCCGGDQSCQYLFSKKACTQVLEYHTSFGQVLEYWDGVFSDGWRQKPTLLEPEECLDADKICGDGSGLELFQQSLDTFCAPVEAKCKGGSADSCSDYANHCCGHENDKCICDYTKRACMISLSGAEVNMLGLRGGLPKECFEADKACCNNCEELCEFRGLNVDPCGCGCDFWNEACITNINKPGLDLTCDIAAGRCCGSPVDDEHNPWCYCEYYSSLREKGIERQLEKNDPCAEDQIKPLASNIADEHDILRKIYDQLGGADWFKGSDWLEEKSDCPWYRQCISDHCEWYGIVCTEGFVSSIDLAGNNVVGPFPSKLLSKLYKLKSINLADNNLTGNIEYRSLYNLQNLVHVDLSRNSLSGEVDALLSPTLEHLNSSYNNHASMMPFIHDFPQSHRTLRVLDLSHNFINQDATEILQYMPTGLKQLSLANNLFSGSFPESLPVFSDVERFLMNDNNMTGQIPDISRHFPRIRELNLSNQKHGNVGFTGPIPSTWAGLLDLTLLDISSNDLAGELPPDIGNLPKLKEFNMSNNNLGGSVYGNEDRVGVPKELGKLAGICVVFDISNNGLTGRIPSEFGSFTGVVMTGNNNL